MIVQSLWKGLMMGYVDKPTIHEVVREVAARHGMTPEDLSGPRRLRPLVHARQEAMYLARERTGRSLPAIGRVLGNRDHTTIMHGIRAHAERLARV